MNMMMAVRLENAIADKMKLERHFALRSIMTRKKDGTVTVRHRDSMEQQRIHKSELRKLL